MRRHPSQARARGPSAPSWTPPSHSSSATARAGTTRRIALAAGGLDRRGLRVFRTRNPSSCISAQLAAPLRESVAGVTRPASAIPDRSGYVKPDAGRRGPTLSRPARPARVVRLIGAIQKLREADRAHDAAVSRVHHQRAGATTLRRGSAEVRSAANCMIIMGTACLMNAWSRNSASHPASAHATRRDLRARHPILLSIQTAGRCSGRRRRGWALLAATFQSARRPTAASRFHV